MAVDVRMNFNYEALIFRTQIWQKKMQAGCWINVLSIKYAND